MIMQIVVLGSPFLFGSFLVLSALLCTLGLFHVRRLMLAGELDRSAFRRSLVALVAWVVLWGALGVSSFLNRWDTLPPRTMLAMLLLFGATIAFGMSRMGAKLAHHSTHLVLVGVQAFRFPLELLLYRAAAEGIMPEQMSFAGSNYDVLTGVAAVAIVIFYRSERIPAWLLWCFNALGVSLLANVLTIAVISMPTFAAFGAHRTNTWITHFPYIYLPAIMVQMALLGHILSLRKLIASVGARQRVAVTDKPDTTPNQFPASGT